jgi:hypothetical protein
MMTGVKIYRHRDLQELCRVQILVSRTLEDRWPIGSIIFGTAFFTIARSYYLPSA